MMMIAHQSVASVFVLMAVVALVTIRDHVSSVLLADVPTPLCPAGGCVTNPWTNEPVTVKIMMLEDTREAFSVEAPMWDEFFTDHNTSVYVVRGDLNAVRYNLPVLLASGEVADLIVWQTVAMFSDQTYDLTPIALEQNWTAQFSPPILATVKFGGRFKALPFTIESFGIMFLTELFAALGLVAPETWAEFWDVCLALVNAGITPICLGEADLWELETWFEYLVLGMGGPQVFQDMEDGNINFATDPVNIAIWTLLQEMLDNGFFPKPSVMEGISISEALDDWASGSCAMILVTSVALGPGVDFFPFPYPPPVYNVTLPRTELVSMSVLAVNQDANGRDVCLDFIRLVSTANYSLATYASAGGNVPANLAVLPLITDPTVLRAITMLNNASQLFIPMDEIIGPSVQAFEVLWFQFFAGTLSDTPEGSIVAVCQGMETVRQEIMLGTAVVPTATPDGGVFAAPQGVTLTTATVNGSMYYSLVDISNGANPADTYNLYTGQVTVPEGAWRMRFYTEHQTPPVLIDSPITEKIFDVAVTPALELGQEIVDAPNVLLYVLATFDAAVVAYTTLILAEQLDEPHRQWREATESGPRRDAKQTTLLWLVLVALASNIAQWTSSLVGIAAINIPDLSLVPSLQPMAFMVTQTFCAVLLPFVPKYLAYYIMSARSAAINERLASRKEVAANGASSLASRYTTTTTTTRGATQTKDTVAISIKVATTAAKNGAKNVAMTGSSPSETQTQSLSQHVTTLGGTARRYAHSVFRRYDRHVGISALLVTASVAGGHFLIMNGVVLACSVEYNVSYIVAALLVTWFFATWGLMMIFYFRATQLRAAGAIPMAFALVSFNFIVTSGAGFRYDPSRAVTDASVISNSLVIYIGVVVAAVVCFLLIGINVNKLKLSRDTYSAHLQAGAATNANLRIQIDEFKQALVIQEFENLLTRNPRFVHLLASNIASRGSGSSTSGDVVGSGNINSGGTIKGGSNGNGDNGNVGGGGSEDQLSLGVPSEHIASASTISTTITNLGRAHTSIDVAAATTSAARSSLYTVQSISRVKPTLFPKPTLDKLLGNAATLARMRRLAIEGKTIEQFDFLSAVETVRKMDQSQSENIKQVCTDVIDIFINPGAAAELNFSGAQRTATTYAVDAEKKKDAPSQKIFDSCEAEIKKLITANDFARMPPEELDNCAHILHLCGQLKSTVHETHIQNANNTAVNLLGQLQKDSRTCVPQTFVSATPTAWTPL
jgi:ABC-type glycerol-3-phosphate transport system substrate-binding protein